MSFASNMANTASRLLAKYGSVITATRNTATYDPTTGGNISTQTSYSGVGNTTTYTALEVNNTTILASDIKLLFYSDTIPAVADIMTINSVNYRVMNVNADSVNNINVLYTIQLRK